MILGIFFLQVRNQQNSQTFMRYSNIASGLNLKFSEPFDVKKYVLTLISCSFQMSCPSVSSFSMSIVCVRLSTGIVQAVAGAPWYKVSSTRHRSTWCVNTVQPIDVTTLDRGSGLLHSKQVSPTLRFSFSKSSHS